MGQKVDLTGQRFGSLFVIRESRERKKGGEVLWVCRCDCGEIKKIRGYPLRTGKTISCGCKLKTKMDLTGKRFGFLTVVREKEESGRGPRIWLCRCDCGRMVYKKQGDLRPNLKKGSKGRRVKSCGCLSGRTIDLIGKRFGKLVVLRRAVKNYGSYASWVCKCDCGTIYSVSGHNLRAGRTSSCGCSTRVWLKFGEKWASPKEKSAYKRRLLADSYIKGMLTAHYKIKKDQINNKIIELKREQIQLFRELKKGREQLNGTS